MSDPSPKNAASAEAFRAEARAWVAAHFPASLAGRAPAAGQRGLDGDGDFERWKEALCARGWGTPTWPKAYGGGGLSVEEARVLRQEIRLAGGWNPIGWMMGVRMFGPTLLEFGTEEQKQEHIPPICSGELRWCQGFSEPGAGSDLASLQTKAEDKGDHFLVNGQKIWTSGAHHADWCFCLVRTDNSKKHEGISFLLINMRTPGVETRPIRLISGNSPFCETFFTDVKVPKKNLVGPLHGGWTVAKRLLQYERQRSEDAPARPGEATPLYDIAKRIIGLDTNQRLRHYDLRARLTQHLMEARALKLTIDRSNIQAAGRGPNATTSILKNVASVVNQTRAELLIEIYGSRGLGEDGDGFTGEEIAATREWLSGKASTIYAGSYEVQNNIIAKRILGLPDAPTR